MAIIYSDVYSGEAILTVKSDNSWTLSITSNDLSFVLTSAEAADPNAEITISTGAETFTAPASDIFEGAVVPPMKPDPIELEGENLETVKAFVKSAFESFDYLGNSTETVTNGDLTAEAVMTTGADSSWTMAIIGKQILLTITSDEVSSDSEILIDLNGVSYKASASAITGDSVIPEGAEEFVAKTFFRNFDLDSFILDVIQTHRGIGDFGATLEEAIQNKANEKYLASLQSRLADFEARNNGNTGIADYGILADKDVSIEGSLSSLGLRGTGSYAGHIGNVYDPSASTTGMMFNVIEISASAEEETGHLIINGVFAEDNSELFENDCGLTIKAGSGIYILIDCDYGYAGAGTGGENLMLTPKTYTISTSVPSGSLIPADIGSNGFTVCYEGIEYKALVNGLSGTIDGYMGLDIIMQPFSMLSHPKATLTIDSFGIPTPGTESITVNGEEISYQEIYDEISQK